MHVLITGKLNLEAKTLDCVVENIMEMFLSRFDATIAAGSLKK